VWSGVWRRTSSAVKTSAVETETVIVLISLTLMKVVSDNMADSPDLRFREPSHSHLINQSGSKMFNNKHQSLRDHALDPEICGPNSEASRLFLCGMHTARNNTSNLSSCFVCLVKIQHRKFNIRLHNFVH
jgi:hypothetical protein